MKVDWLQLIFMVLIVNLLVQTYIWDLPSESKITKEPCYDNYNNKIIGATCEHKITSTSLDKKLLLSTVTITMSLLLSITLNIRRDDE